MNGHTPYIKVALRVRIELYRANEWYILYQELYHKICHCHNNNLYSTKMMTRCFAGVPFRIWQIIIKAN